MGKKWSYKGLEDFGRTRLSKNFYMREFLHSEVAQVYGLVNAPDDPDLAIRNGAKLCSEILEPILDAWGGVHIRSGYRSPEVNSLGNKKKHNCASNRNNAAAHIWDILDNNSLGGATACIVIPRYQDYFEKTGDWVSLAWWLHENIPAYFEMCFFKLQGAFNIRWYEGKNEDKTIKSFLINPDTENKRNLVTEGVILDYYDEKKITNRINKANRIRENY